jgi:hypothetical protein
MGALARCGIEIHAQYLCVREECGKFLFHALSAYAAQLHAAASALGALLMRLPDESTVMAPEVLLREVVRQGDAAVVALLRVAAVLAFHEGSEPAAVLQKYDAFLFLKPEGYFAPKEIGDGRLLEFLQFRPLFGEQRFLQRSVCTLPLLRHIHDAYLRHWHPVDAVRHAEESELSC